MTDGQLEAGAAVILGVLDRNLLGIRHIAHQFTQANRCILGGHVAHFRRRQLDDGDHAVPARACVPVLDQLAFALGAFLDFLDETTLRVLQLGQDFQCATVGRTIRQFHVDDDLVRFDFRHEALLHPAGTKHAEADDQHRDEDTGGEIGPVHRPLADTPVITIGKSDDAVGDSLLEAPEAAQLGTRFQLRKVSRKNQQRLHQRERQRQNHHPGDVPGEFARRATEKKPGQKRHHGGEDREDHRLGHQLSAQHGGTRRVLALVVVALGVNRLADDDRVVDHDPQHQQECKGGEHVQGHTHGRQKDECSGVGRSNTHRDPEGHLGSQGEHQHRHHQQQAQRGRTADRCHPALEVLGIIGPQGQLSTGRQTFPPFRDPLVDRLRRLDDVHGLGGHDLQEDGRLAIQRGQDLEILEAVDDRSHITDPDRAAFGRLTDDNLGEFPFRVRLVADLQLVFADFRADRAGRLVDGTVADGIGNILETQPVTPQRGFADFDGNLFAPGSEQFDDRNRRQRRHLATKVFGKALQFALAEVAVHGDPDILLPVDPLPHQRRFDISRKRRDRVDPDLDVIHELREVDLLLGEHVDLAAALVGGRTDPLDGVHIANRLFDSSNDLLFDVLRRRARPGHIDRQTREPDLWVHLPLQRHESDNAGNENTDHHEVGGDRVAGPPVNQLVHGISLLPGSPPATRHPL